MGRGEGCRVSVRNGGWLGTSEEAGRKAETGGYGGGWTEVPGPLVNSEHSAMAFEILRSGRPRCAWCMVQT